MKIERFPNYHSKRRHGTHYVMNKHFPLSTTLFYTPQPVSHEQEHTQKEE